MINLLTDGEYTVFFVVLLTIILSLSFHEFGHAWAAKKFGDDTAERLGRLTLNPFRHIDPMGLLMVIMIGFGYARPVPVRPSNFTSFWAQMLVAAAGPAANLIIAVVVVNLYAYGVGAGWAFLENPQVEHAIAILVIINMVLMVFNLIPLGPLDGHYILPYFLPRALARSYVELNSKYGTFVLLGLVFAALLGLPVFRFVFEFGAALVPYINFM